MSKVKAWSNHEDHTLMEQLMTSFLIQSQGLSIDTAADTYDDMNDNTVYHDMLVRLGLRD